MQGLARDISGFVGGQINHRRGDIGAGTDVAAAVVYLASDEAAYVTGQTLHVNGGMAMI